MQLQSGVQPNTSYTILNAASLTGTFSGVTTVLPFLKPSLAYNGGTVTLLETVATADSERVIGFDVDPFRKRSLLNGWDDIGLTLSHADEIRAFEARHLAEQPWL